MFKSSSIENELMQSMEKQLLVKQAEDKTAGLNKLVKALNYINAAASIFEKAGMLVEAKEMTNILQVMVKKSCKDKSVNGLAHKNSNNSYSLHFIKQALSLEEFDDVTDKLKDMKSFDIKSEDLKNLFWASPIGIQVAIINKLYELFKDTKNEGLVNAIKDQLKELDITDPEKAQELKDSISSKLSTVLKAIRIAELFA